MIRSKPSALWRVLLLAAVTFSGFFLQRAVSQTTFGSIVGNVSDSTGAGIGGTQVDLTNIGTGEKRSITTNPDGAYTFVNLAPGDYRVEVSKPGFKRTVQGPITVSVETTVKIDLALQLGEVSQTVEVTSQTPQIQTESASLGTVVDERKATELPLNGRNPLNLVSLVPSVVPQGGSMSNPNGQNPFAWGNYQIGGGLANQSMVWLDGSPVNGSYINITALIPTQDSLQEFKVATNNLTPEYGRFAGGVVNFTTKSGTNELHGSAWEFLRNKDLNANGFFNNAAGVDRPAFTQNQFGFNLGGPVYIPKVYDGRNKTFFFVDYEGFRLRQGESFTETVPTAAERGADLSALGTPIYDPLTTCGSGAPGTPACASGQAQYSRTPFAGGIIPASRINSTSLAFLKQYPLPNTTGGVDGVGNYVANASVGGNNNETVVHLDQNISEKNHLSARYSYWGNINLPIDPLGTGVCQDRCTETFNTNNFVLSDVHTFTPTLVLEIRASYQRFDYNRVPKTLGYDLTQLGWPASYNTEADFLALPVASISGFDTAGTFSSQGAGSVIIDRNDNDRVAGTLTKIAGKQTLQFGGEFMRMTHNYAQTNIPTGYFTFGSDLTSANAISGGGGLGLASFLLGYADSGSAQTPALVAASQLYPALFFNDKWNITPHITLTLGARWEHSGPWTERFNRQSYFNPTGSDPLLTAAGLSYPGTIDLVNSSTNGNRSNINPDWKQFAPRVGVAWQVTPKTVVHTGYGIFWLPNDVAWDTSPNNDPINNFSTPYTSTVYTGVPASSISVPFPNGILPSPGRTTYQSTLLGQGLTLNQLGNPYGYAQQWNFDIQREVAKGLVLDVAYGGAKGTHLPIDSPQIDQLPDADLALGTKLTQNVANPFYGIVTSGPLAAQTIQYGQLLRPYPEYNGINFAGQGIGNSSYNSLQVKAEKRFSGGNSILVAYTFAKLITNTDSVTNWLEAGGGTTYQDYNNLAGERSLSANDVPNRLVVSYVLDVPVGKGRRYLNNANQFLQQTVGGWGIQGVTTVQNGFPLHFNTSQNLTSSFGGGSRPNVLGPDEGVSGSAQQRISEWFNTADFAQPAAFTFGDEPRVDPNLRAAGIANWDFAAVKKFPFGPEGRINAQFRAEVFNLFNRVQFSPPGTTFGAAGFGVVTSQNNLPRTVQFSLRVNF